jgi:hypothetical protein
VSTGLHDKEQTREAIHRAAMKLVGERGFEAVQAMMADPAAFIDDALRFLEGGRAALRT